MAPTEQGMSSAIDTVGLCRNFGGLVVADAIDFRMEPGARHALIGPNGAGKTTFVNLVSGALRPSSGSIALAGEDITALSQSQRVKRGLVRTFQINALFRRLSALENVTLAIAEREGVAGDFLRPAGRYREAIDEAFALLDGLGLAARAMKPVAELAYGEQRKIEIAIALGLNPRVLLLDEPAAGIPTGDLGSLIDIIERLSTDIAVLLIEHDMDLVFRFARTITVLVGGRILIEGAPEVIAADPMVRRVYLGERGRR
jgi:ABC-type branched-subunit amino acid transport system ATPase component